MALAPTSTQLAKAAPVAGFFNSITEVTVSCAPSR
jgi:hypothetical protein